MEATLPTEARTDALDIPGSDRALRLVTLTGDRSGPTLAVLGSIHGDELEGPLAITALLDRLAGTSLRGRLIALPVSNPDAVAAGTRCTPSDGKNLARCFPGDIGGSVTEALAALITKHAITPADALVDLHSAGTASESPLFCGYSDSPGDLGARSEAMALAFGAPVVWRHAPPTPPGRTISEAEAQGTPAIYLEANGGPFPPQEVIDAYTDGVLKVMAHLDMIDSAPPASPPPLRLHGSGDTDAPTVAAPVAGLLTRHVNPLDRVEAGQLCYTIRDAGGAVVAEVRAEATGLPVFLRRARWTEAGELLLVQAQPDEVTA